MKTQEVGLVHQDARQDHLVGLRGCPRIVISQAHVLTHLALLLVSSNIILWWVPVA